MIMNRVGRLLTGVRIGRGEISENVRCIKVTEGCIHVWLLCSLKFNKFWFQFQFNFNNFVPLPYNTIPIKCKLFETYHTIYFKFMMNTAENKVRHTKNHKHYVATLLKVTHFFSIQKITEHSTSPPCIHFL